MKKFLLATAALSLIGGAAFAQSSVTMPDNTQPAISPAVSPGAVTPPQSVGAQTGADGAGTMSPTPAPAAPTATPAPDSSTTPTPPPTDMNSTSTVAANTPSGSPPATYPICTSKHEDRCVNRYQATRMASTSHMKRTKHSAATMDTTTTGDQPAASPST
jgi:hypothetical protein